MSLTIYAKDILDSFFLMPDDEQWVIIEIEDLAYQFEHPQWPMVAASKLHTQKQVGYLTGMMNLEERDDRIKVIELIMGYPLYYVLGEWYPGITEPENPDLYPGPSLKDVRMTRWETSVLLEYYINGNGHELNERLGLTSATSVAKKKRDKKLAQKQTQTNGTATDQQSEPAPTDLQDA